MSCVFCKQTALYGIELSDGNIIHGVCYDRAKKELDALRTEIDETRKKQRDAENEESAIDGIFRFFSGRQKKYQAYDIAGFKRRIEFIQKRISEIENCLIISMTICSNTHQTGTTDAISFMIMSMGEGDSEAANCVARPMDCMCTI